MFMMFYFVYIFRFIVKGGWTALLTFLDIKNGSDFYGLNLTNQSFAHLLTILNQYSLI